MRNLMTPPQQFCFVTSGAILSSSLGARSAIQSSKARPTAMVECMRHLNGGNYGSAWVASSPFPALCDNVPVPPQERDLAKRCEQGDFAKLLRVSVGAPARHISACVLLPSHA